MVKPGRVIKQEVVVRRRYHGMAYITAFATVAATSAIWGTYLWRLILDLVVCTENVIGETTSNNEANLLVCPSLRVSSHVRVAIKGMLMFFLPNLVGSA